MELMTVKEAAEELRVSRRVVRSLWADGKLPGSKIGKAIRFRREDVMALLPPVKVQR